MVLALLDAPTGLAGNMLLAALLDLGLPEEQIHRPLAALGLADAYRLELEERRSGGLRGLHLTVVNREPQPPHRHWGELRGQLQAAPWEPALKQRVLGVFGLLAQAEAAVHGHSPEQVHFHEVGALDALVDVVGVCAGLLHFGVGELVCSPPPAGHGVVATAHGTLPLPAPAVLELARLRAIPLASAEGFPPGELTTPTGLALVACWASRFGHAPTHVPRQVGVGLGSRQLDRPNLLRLTLAESLLAEPQPAEATQADLQLETVLIQQAQIDDATPEDLAFLSEELRRAGALEVFSQSIAMKKGRVAQLLTALVAPEQASALRQVWWLHSTSLGVREQAQSRWVLPRRSLELDTPLGPVRIKQARLPDGRWRSKPEHDDLVALARQHTLGIDQVRAIVQHTLEHSFQP
ncbi:nickel pincer cofactor biosynthesis protein LarC [Cyanobium sp. FACHB-13342]|uniref:nickel pincer cofactor biosynthesis protein LarC n=1 Tax=Cyanobium sp. FACHB-13342 TaxID=2692793 RepID=UPI001680B286|nr:nickel pincer cofactor biosynthesis protein LarC [Cyanobium sp. FACHB-13342]MBD2424243.1 nickel pincer cofactor biosynthesis protein LarC [Cyanobium sp. FACHB-13342]